MAILYHSTNNKTEQVGFRQALLNGIASNYGLYMMERKDIPRLSLQDIEEMESKPYAQIAYRVLLPYVVPDIAEDTFLRLLEDAYNESVIPVEIQHVTGKKHIMWLSKGPTYSFKDFAALFFGRVLNHFLGESGLKKTVVVATSGDTGGAVAFALHGLENVSNIVFFPRDSISEQQRRQMTTLGDNIHAFSIRGDFDVCQEIAKNLLSDKSFAAQCLSDPERFTSANSISLGRLLPQAVYPFFAYSRLGLDGKTMIASIPSGNFGDIMGTLIAKAMGLPVKKIICGVNENRQFPDFLRTGEYRVKPSLWSPSTAMIVSHPSNLARLVEFYGGRMYDERDPETNKVIRQGVIEAMPELDRMRDDIYTVSVTNKEHYTTIREVFDSYGVILDPHGAVGWKALDLYLGGKQTETSVVYETAEPGKFPKDIEKAIGIQPSIPEGIQKQTSLKENLYEVQSGPLIDKAGNKYMSEEQYEEVKRIIRSLSRDGAW